MNKKPKIQKIRTEADKKAKMSSLAFSGIALLITLGVFAGLLFLQNALTNDIIYQQVIVAKTEVPEGTFITKDNAEGYFTVKNVNVLDATTGYMTDITPVLDCRLKVALHEGEIVSAKDFADTAAYTGDIKDPVEIAVSIENIADADGGRIRGGDLVNLSMMYARDQLRMSDSFTTAQTSTVTGITRPITVVTDEEDNEDEENDDEFSDTESEDITEDSEIKSEPPEQIVSNTPMAPLQMSSTSKPGDSEYKFEFYARYVAQNLYVIDALDASGVVIPPSDKTTPASILVFVIDKADEPEFNNALSNCKNKRVSKVLQVPEGTTKPTITVEDTDEPILDTENSEP